MIKIIIADDCSILRYGLKTIVEQDKDIKVIGCAENGKEALALCKKEIPDLILMDIRMPVCDGIEGTRLIKEYNNKIKVVIITTFEDVEYLSEVLSYGADGYVLKDIGESDLIHIIKSTVNGFNTIKNSVFDKIKNHYESDYKSKNNKINKNLPNLTEREIEVVKMIVDGKSNKEIAKYLNLAEGSIKNLISSLLEKLELKDRTQLAVFAVKNNLIT